MYVDVVLNRTGLILLFLFFFDMRYHMCVRTIHKMNMKETRPN